MVILAALLPRTGERTSPQPQQPPTTTARIETTRTPAPIPTPAPPSTQTVRPLRSERAAVVASRDRESIVAAASFDPGENATTEIAPLKTIAPIQVAPVGQSSIAMEDITVRPLNTISELQIAPLTPPDRRN